MHINTVNLKMLFWFLFLYKRGILALGVISLKDFFEDIKEVCYHYILWGKNYSLFMILFYSSINFIEKRLFSLQLQFPWINFRVKADNLKKKSKQYSGLIICKISIYFVCISKAFLLQITTSVLICSHCFPQNRPLSASCLFSEGKIQPGGDELWANYVVDQADMLPENGDGKEELIVSVNGWWYVQQQTLAGVGGMLRSLLVN